jgi:2-dehydropantoate 2-reductase
MKIAVLGAGAMGCLFGGYLSQRNEVWLIDVDRRRIDTITRTGVVVEEREGEREFRPHAVSDARGMEPMDLVIVFVKAMRSREALEQNRHLIGPHTYLLSLQNGSGHEDTLVDFADRQHVIIGTTQHNSSLQTPGRVHHGGGGNTSIGSLAGDGADLEPIAETFRKCGLDTAISVDVRRQIWSKLFLNASASALTAILQTRLGYIAEDDFAWSLAQRLVREAVAVANADVGGFDPEQVIADVREVLVRARDGYASIYADIRDSRRTEVDAIGGSIVTAARRLGIGAPCHEFVVALIHALEGRERS